MEIRRVLLWQSSDAFPIQANLLLADPFVTMCSMMLVVYHTSINKTLCVRETFFEAESETDNVTTHQWFCEVTHHLSLSLSQSCLHLSLFYSNGRTHS